MPVRAERADEGKGAGSITDNEAVARWLQKTIESLLYPAFADEKQSGRAGRLQPLGRHRRRRERVMVTRDTEIVLSWSDFLPPFVLTMRPGLQQPPDRRVQHFLPGAHAQIW
jgi:hypothetical protein